jgi:hypothetical protein
MHVRLLSAASMLIVVALSVTACSKTTKSDGTTTAVSSTAASNGSTAGSSNAPATTAARASTPAATGRGTLDVCSLLTSAQASSINSVTYGATTPSHVQNVSDACTYANNGSVDPVDIQNLTVTVISLSGCYARLQSDDGPGTKVPGVGEDAFGYSIGIIVKDGDRCIDVSGLTNAELQDNYGPDTAMAKIIISKLS